MRRAMSPPVRPELKMLVAEASRSLAKLDAERLEELALSCKALSCDQSRGNQQRTVRELHEVKQDMAVLAKILEVTRTNLSVMNRHRELHANRMEYSVGQDPSSIAKEVSDGLN
jgi:histidine ammonia-lyase